MASDENQVYAERRKTITFGTLNTQLAVVIANTENIKEDINEIKKNNKAMEKRMGEAEGGVKVACGKAKTNKEEIDRLRDKSNVTDLILAVGTVIAGALGINKKG